MTNLSKLVAAMILTFGLLSTAQASSIELSIGQFAIYQSDAPTTAEDGEEGEEGEKKKEGEEEEPDC